MTDLSWEDCPFGVPASEEEMTDDQEDWALGQMLLARISKDDGEGWILAEDLPE